MTSSSFADDRFIIIKKAHKCSYVFVWDTFGYIKQIQKELWDSTVYEEIKRLCKKINKKIISHLVEFK